MPDRPSDDGTATPTRVVSTAVPRGSLLQNYGGHIGAGGLLIALLEFLGTKPDQAFKLLAQFSIKWIFFIVVAYILWDIAKRILRLLDRRVSGFVDNVGMLSANMGKMAEGVQSFGIRADAQARAQSDANSQMAAVITRIADQASDKDRKLDEGVTMIGVLAKQMDRVGDRLDKQDNSLIRIEDRLGINGTNRSSGTATGETP